MIHSRVMFWNGEVHCLRCQRWPGCKIWFSDQIVTSEGLAERQCATFCAESRHAFDVNWNGRLWWHHCFLCMSWRLGYKVILGSHWTTGNRLPSVWLNSDFSDFRVIFLWFHRFSGDFLVTSQIFWWFPFDFTDFLALVISLIFWWFPCDCNHGSHCSGSTGKQLVLKHSNTRYL